jgi:hypothetical protein
MPPTFVFTTRYISEELRMQAFHGRKIGFGNLTFPVSMIGGMVSLPAPEMKLTTPLGKHSAKTSMVGMCARHPTFWGWKKNAVSIDVCGDGKGRDVL